LAPEEICMDSWEELEKLNENEWPDLLSSLSAPKFRKEQRGFQQVSKADPSSSGNNKNNDLPQFPRENSFRAESPTCGYQPRVKILSRARNGGNEQSKQKVDFEFSPNARNESKPMKSFQEREEEYALARQRILGNCSPEQQQQQQQQRKQ